MAPVELDAEAICEVLNRHGVQYVVIGGYAAVLYGLPRATEDLDVTPAATDDNLVRLAAALTELDAKLLAPGADSPLEGWTWTDGSLRNFTTVTTRTKHGDLDIAFRPDGPGGSSYDYERLARSAIVLELAVDVPVADLDDVIASKVASDRPKDREALRPLQALRDRLRST